LTSIGPFPADVPSTDIYFTEVGRYAPLTNKKTLRPVDAYVLYENARFVMSRTDILFRGNHDSVPKNLLGGQYELVGTDAQGLNAVYRRSESSLVTVGPGLFTENVAQVSYVRDVRIGADRDARIGLNETQLGIGLPLAVVETLRWQVPGSSLAPLALEGRLVSPREALQLGLLHEVVPEADLLTRALERANTMAALPPAGLRMVKESLRKPAAAAARANESAESERWLDTWFSADSQRKLREAVARLKK